MTETTLKFRRLAPKKYAAATSCGHTVIAERFFSYWQLYFDGGYVLNRHYRTLTDAKHGAPLLLDTLRVGWEKRQTDEAAKAKAAVVARVESVIRQCRLADSKIPPAGVPWHEWAERRVGCTAAQVRAMNAGTDRINELFSELDELTGGDWNACLSEWYGAPVKVEWEAA